MPDAILAGGAMRAAKSVSLTNPPDWLFAALGAGQGGTLGAYLASAGVFRAIEIRAGTVAAGELRLYAADDSEIDDHPILDVLAAVNAEWNASDLWTYTEAGICVHGAGYWQKVRAGRELKELFYLNPGTVTPKFTPRGIEKFTQRLGVVSTDFKREDVVYFRGAYDPSHDLKGLAPLRWAINAALGEDYAEKYMAAFFQNGAVPALVLSTPQQLGDAETTRILSWWQRLFQGVGNSHKTGIVGNDLKPVTVGTNPKDLALPEVRAELRRTVCIALGVPELLISATASADLTPVELAMKVLYYTTVIPRWRAYAETLNVELLSEYPDLVSSGAYLDFDIDDIEALQEDAISKTERLVSLVGAGIISKVAAAKELGYEEADVPAPEPTPAPIVMQQTPIPAPPPPPPEPPPPPAQRALAERDRALWQRKALNALAKGKGASVPFASDALSVGEHERISEALAECKTADDVRAVFDQAAPARDPQLDELIGEIREARKALGHENA
jgi:HK97 family phage portal protein